MNRNQLLILLVLAAVVGGAGVMVYQKQNASRQEGNAGIGRKLLGDLPVNDVAHLTVRHDTNEVNLVRQDDQWRVRERDGYPADFPRISGFLLKARELKVVQSEPVGPSQLARLDLATGQGSNSPVVVEFKDAGGKAIRTLLLGKKHMKKSTAPSMMGEAHSFPDGRWVKADANAENVAVISDPLEDIEPGPANWLNKDFFRVEKAKSIAVTLPVATNSWKLVRDTEAGDWKLADAKAGEEADSSKLAGASNLFASPTFTDVRPGGRLEGEGTNQPVRVVIETFDGFVYTIHVGAETDDHYPLTVAVEARLPGERTPGKDEKPEDKAKLDKEFQDQQQKLGDKLKQEQNFARWTYSVPGWVVEPALQERARLMADKKPDGEAGASGGAASTEFVPPAPVIN